MRASCRAIQTHPGAAPGTRVPHAGLRIVGARRVEYSRDSMMQRPNPALALSVDLDENFLCRTHPGVAPSVASFYTDAARVCLRRHHRSPTAWSMSVLPDPPVQVELQWIEPGARVLGAYKNALRATENGAYALALAATELLLGLVALCQAEAETGGDYYLIPAGTATTDDPNLDLDRDDVVLFEVSGIDLDDDAKMAGRLREKTEQVRAQEWSGLAFAGVVGFRNARAWLMET